MRPPARCTLPSRPLLLALALALAPAVSLPLTVSGPARALATAPVGEWPLRPRPVVARAFDPPTTPWGAGHRGVDLVGRPGQVVRTALPGTVTYAAGLAGRGVVVVSHGSTRTTYEPVEADVSPGQEVASGARLGTLQTAPSHCLPRVCLHWGWIDTASGTYLDPMRLVGAGPVRLLPFLSALTSPTLPAPAPTPGSTRSAPGRDGFALDPRLGVL